MAVLQNAYASTIPVGFAGQVFNGETSNRISRTLEDATPLPAGNAAYLGTGDHGCTGTPTAGKLYGFAILNEGGVASAVGVNTNPGYGQYANVGILTKGVMDVSAAVSVNKGDQVYVTPAGLITNVAGGNVIAPNWFFDNTITAAGIVRIANRA